MNVIRCFTVLAAALVFFLSSCSKKDKKDDVAPVGSGMVVKIDGKEFVPDLAHAKDFPGKADYFGIYGISSVTSDILVIALPKTAAEGTYELGKTNQANLTYGADAINLSFSTVVEPGSGTVTIIKKTATEVIGTFSFTGFNDKGEKRVISDGKFDVKFQ